ncbi:prepilin-type N-terminal cleavage/methylation domain-containing protein [Candidatus Saccharibacteria bacterium]|nr:prepilin-type N-terminal cleavage/methylation domain-containing protein [Candidatus Saccharibacteria bacterium]
MTHRRLGGFTIVELLIVIVVITILAAITIVAYNGIQERSRTAAVQSDLRNLSQLVRLKTADSVPLNTSTITSILQESGMYQATSTRQKVFSFCYNGANNSQFAIIAFDPLTPSTSVANGDTLQALTSSRGLIEITYDTSVASTGTGTRACSIALPESNNQIWSFNV